MQRPEKLPYEEMDKGDNIDSWFLGGYTLGNEIILYN
jgi:hypothetical protein